MVQDQYRAVMQYSGAYRAVMQYGATKESMGKEKIVTDWYCAKVSRYQRSHTFKGNF